MDKKQFQALVNKGAITHVGVDSEKLTDKEFCEKYITKHEVAAEVLSGEGVAPEVPTEPKTPEAPEEKVEETSPAEPVEPTEDAAPTEEVAPEAPKKAKKTSKKSEAPVVG